jgi:hypothetical protein
LSGRTEGKDNPQRETPRHPNHSPLFLELHRFIKRGMRIKKTLEEKRDEEREREKEKKRKRDKERKREREKERKKKGGRSR